MEAVVLLLADLKIRITADLKARFDWGATVLVCSQGVGQMSALGIVVDL